jgi:hypothetical protein
VFIISLNKWTVYFDNRRPKIIKSWVGKQEVAPLRGTTEQQIKELMVRLRQDGIASRLRNPFFDRYNKATYRNERFSWGLVVANDDKMLFFMGLKPRVEKTWRGGIELAVLRGSPAQQVEELKSRLRYQSGVKNNITDPNWEKPTKKLEKPTKKEKNKNSRKRRLFG